MLSPPSAASHTTRDNVYKQYLQKDKRNEHHGITVGRARRLLDALNVRTHSAFAAFARPTSPPTWISAGTPPAIVAGNDGPNLRKHLSMSNFEVWPPRRVHHTSAAGTVTHPHCKIAECAHARWTIGPAKPKFVIFSGAGCAFPQIVGLRRKKCWCYIP